MARFGYLILRQEDNDDLAYALTAETTIIGRDPQADITLADAPVSRRHAALHCSADGTVHLQDLRSSNGTWVNKQPIRPNRPVELNDGDQIILGESTLHYRAPTLLYADDEAQTALDQSPRLIIETPQRTWHEHFIAQRLTLGRAAENDIIIEDERVSPIHARLIRSSETAIYKDLGSEHGSYLDGERVEEHQWQGGENIQIGECRIYFRPSWVANVTRTEQVTMQTRTPAWQSPEKRKLVVLVPGTMGSELYYRKPGYGRRIRIWPDIQGLKNQDVSVWPNPLEVGNILSNTLVIEGLFFSRLEGYSKAINFLINTLGYRLNETLISAPYDWRQPIARSAEKLGKLIREWPTRRGRKVTIIGHSMGALIARYYVERLGGYRYVEQLVILGGPNHGTPEALAGLMVGPKLIGPLRPVPALLMPTMRTFPAMYEILPDYPCVINQHDEAIDHFDDDRWLLEEFRPLLHQGRQLLRTLSEIATIPTTVIWGYGQKTTTGLRVYQNDDGSWEQIELVTTDQGDGTIPYESALLKGASFHPVCQNHGALHVDQDVQMRLIMELIENK